MTYNLLNYVFYYQSYIIFYVVNTRCENVKNSFFFEFLTSFSHFRKLKATVMYNSYNKSELG